MSNVMPLAPTPILTHLRTLIHDAAESVTPEMLLEFRRLYQRLQGEGMVAHLPWLPLRKYQRLPAIPAVYYVLAPTEMLYIGSTHNLQMRWRQHHRLENFQTTPGPITIAWQDMSENVAALRHAEQEAITRFSPRLNMYGTPAQVPAPPKPMTLTALPSVKAKREAAGLTMSELARRTNMRLTKLWKIEHGERALKARDIAILAQALGCDKGDLVPDVDEEAAPVNSSLFVTPTITLPGDSHGQ